MAKKTNTEFNQDQGQLFVAGSNGNVPTDNTALAFPTVEGDYVDLGTRSERLIETTYLLGKMSANHGFNKALNNPQMAQNIYDDIGTDGVGKINIFIERAKADRPERLRILFNEATGYKAQPQDAKEYDKNLVDNKAFRKFKKTFENSGNQKSREKLRKQLIKQRKALNQEPFKKK